MVVVMEEEEEEEEEGSEEEAESDEEDVVVVDAVVEEQDIEEDAEEEEEDEEKEDPPAPEGEKEALRVPSHEDAVEAAVRMASSHLSASMSASNRKESASSLSSWVDVDMEES